MYPLFQVILISNAWMFFFRACSGSYGIAQWSYSTHFGSSWIYFASNWRWRCTACGCFTKPTNFQHANASWIGTFSSTFYVASCTILPCKPIPSSGEYTKLLNYELQDHFIKRLWNLLVLQIYEDLVGGAFVLQVLFLASLVIWFTVSIESLAPSAVMEIRSYCTRMSFALPSCSLMCCLLYFLTLVVWCFLHLHFYPLFNMQHFCMMMRDYCCCA